MIQAVGKWKGSMSHKALIRSLDPATGWAAGAASASGRGAVQDGQPQLGGGSEEDWLRLDDVVMLKSFKLVMVVSMALWLDVTNCPHHFPDGSFLNHPGQASGLCTEAAEGTLVQ